MNDYKNDIELRSEKVRNIVGHIPPILLRRGITVTSIVMVLVIAGICFIPYTETITVPVTMSVYPNQVDVYSSIIYTSDKYTETLKKGAKIKIELLGFPRNEYGEIEGEISRVYSALDNGKGIKVDVSFPNELRTSKGYIIENLSSLGGYVYITFSKHHMLYRLLRTNN